MDKKYRKNTPRRYSSGFRRQTSKDSSFRNSSFKRFYNLRDSPPPDIPEDIEPVLPSLSTLNVIPGYEFVTFTPFEIPPPMDPCNVYPDVKPVYRPLTSSSELNEKDVKKALLDYVSNRYCYGKTAAKDMIIIKLDHSCVFHYILESFTECRSLCWTFEPYFGGHVDENENIPNAWSIVLNRPPPFENHVTSQPLPATQSIRTCHHCSGIGRKRCTNCNSNGFEQCYSCNGDGYKGSPFISSNEGRCYYCDGMGKRVCRRCYGDTMVQCPTCIGTGQIKCFIKMNVKWSNHMDDFISDNEYIPKEMLKLVNGHIVIDEMKETLWPIEMFQDHTVNEASRKLIGKHRESYFVKEKPLLQRQRVHSIPITRVEYCWKGKPRTFWVYGNEREIYAPDYPQKHCFGCSII